MVSCNLLLSSQVWCVTSKPNSNRQPAFRQLTFDIIRSCLRLYQLIGAILVLCLYKKPNFISVGFSVHVHFLLDIKASFLFSKKSSGVDPTVLRATRHLATPFSIYNGIDQSSTIKSSLVRVAVCKPDSHRQPTLLRLTFDLSPYRGYAALF